VRIYEVGLLLFSFQFCTIQLYDAATNQICLLKIYMFVVQKNGVKMYSGPLGETRTFFSPTSHGTLKIAI